MRPRTALILAAVVVAGIILQEYVRTGDCGCGRRKATLHRWFA